MKPLFTDLQPWHESDEALAKKLEAIETEPATLYDLAFARPEMLPDPDQMVWEPCTGTGILADALRQLGYSVFCSDVHDWGYHRGYHVVQDVFDFTEAPCSEVVTNPPFSRAHEVVRHLLSIGVRRIVLYHGWNWFVQAGDKQRLFRDLPPAYVLALDRRVGQWHFTKPIAERKHHSQQRFAWYVWEAGHRGDTRFNHLPRIEGGFPVFRRD